MTEPRVVVDASVVAKWFVSEVFAEESSALRRGASMLCPDHMVAEVANTIWKKHRLSQIGIVRAGQIVDQLAGLPVRIVPAGEVLVHAFDLAVRHDRTVYDSLYLALALREQCKFVTADLKLFNSLRDGYPTTMLWVADIPAWIAAHE